MNFKSFFTFILLNLFVTNIFGQTFSSNNISYKLTFDKTTSLYTVWVVPNYSVPNSNFVGPNELGPTAQTTIALPCSINITAITDIHGIWQKPGSSGWLKYGPSLQPQLAGQGLDPNTCYYTLGKSPLETDYGVFTNGVPVGLYTFATSGCAGPVRIIQPNEPVIKVGLDQMSWNLGNSFYSRSGQVNSAGSTMIEQFASVVGNNANCVIVPHPDAYTTPNNTPIVNNVLINDKLGDSTQVTNANVIISIISQANCATAVVNSDGTITFSPNGTTCVGKQCYTYQICDKANPTVCATTQSCVTIGQPAVTIVANPENTTVNQNASVIQPVLINDLLNGVQAINSNVTTTIVTPPTCGTAVVNTDGTITYNSGSCAAGQYCYTYKICDKLNPTICSSTQNCITVVNSVPTSDLAVTKTVNNTNANINDILTYTITVKNNGPTDATNVTVSDPISSNLQLISATPSSGTFSITSNIWSIPQLANGATQILTISAKVVAEGVATNTATITGQDGTDPISSNNSATVCSTVPMMLCQNASLNLTVPSTYSNVKWFRNGTQLATGLSYTAVAAGTYTWTADNNTCPLSGCCPIIVTSMICCTNPICLPVSILKVN